MTGLERSSSGDIGEGVGVGVGQQGGNKAAQLRIEFLRFFRRIKFDGHENAGGRFGRAGQLATIIREPASASACALSHSKSLELFRRSPKFHHRVEQIGNGGRANELADCLSPRT